MDERLKLLYVLTAPVVLHPPNDHSPLPQPLKDKIILSRIENVLSGDFDRGLCSIADLVAYLYSASLKFPIPGDYVTIYSYYADKLFNGALRKAGLRLPDKLTPYQEMLAERLRRKILEAQIRALGKAPTSKKRRKRKSAGRKTEVATR